MSLAISKALAELSCIRALVNYECSLEAISECNEKAIEILEEAEKSEPPCLECKHAFDDGDCGLYEEYHCIYQKIKLDGRYTNLFELKETVE